MAENKKGVPLNFPAKETLHLVKTKPRYTTVEKNIPRLKIEKKNDVPNPATYKPLDSFKKAIEPN